MCHSRRPLRQLCSFRALLCVARQLTTYDHARAQTTACTANSTARVSGQRRYHQTEREREVGWHTPSQLARDLPGGLVEGEGCRPSCRLARGLPDGHAKPLREATVQLMAMQVAGHTATWKRMYHFGGYKHIQRAHLKKMHHGWWPCKIRTSDEQTYIVLRPKTAILKLWD